MSQAILGAAKELITQKKYDEARAILMTIKDHPTAAKWLAKLNAPPYAPVNEALVAYTPMPQYPVVPPPNYGWQDQQSVMMESRQRAADFDYIVASFVQKDWTVKSQSRETASLEKGVRSVGLAILLGIIALLVFMFYDLLLGALCIVGALVLVALNNATKRNKNAYVSVTPDGSVQVKSNKRGVSALYSRGYRGKVYL